MFPIHTHTFSSVDGCSLFVEKNMDCLNFHGCGNFSTNSRLSIPQRLSELHNFLKGIIYKYNPTECAIEKVFVNKNPSSTLSLGFARGVILMTAAHCGLEIHEYSPNTIKKAVVGAGHAGKEQILSMAKRLLSISDETVLSYDSADAV